jgi:hypothetical protein
MEQEADMFGLLPGGDNYYSDDSDTSDEDREHSGSDDDYDDVEVDPAIVEEIAKIPKASETERPTVSSLKTLCVVSICVNQYMCNNERESPSELKRQMLVISDPSFDKDLRNLEKCYSLADEHSYQWFPDFEREQFCIRELGIMIAFATFSRSQAAQLVASNMVSSLRQQDNVRTHRRFFFGILPTNAARLAAIGQELVRFSGNKLTEAGYLFESSHDSRTSNDLPVREHVKAFADKYFCE